jgi:hypothetical protein
MLAAEDFYSWDARENTAIARLCTALDEVLVTGRPSIVDCFPASLTNREFVEIAVSLCERAEANVAVLGNATRNALTLVPLVTTVARRPRGKTYGSLAGAGAPRELFI